jgi:hypothetical protein
VSVAAFNDKFDILDDPEEIIIDFKEWLICQRRLNKRNAILNWVKSPFATFEF